MEIVLCINAFICGVVDNQFHSLLRGNLYDGKKDDEGSPKIHCYNFGKIVVPTHEQRIVPTEKLLRKVMLYPEPKNLDSPSCYIVIDFMRMSLPVLPDEVIVPFYPQADDVVIVACGEEYVAHIKNVQEKEKTVKLHYFIEDSRKPGAGLYVRESFGRNSLQTVSWDCIHGLAEGRWQGNAWYIGL